MIRSLNAPLRPRTTPLFPPVLGDDAVEILGPCRPARHTLRIIMTQLVAQHGALAGGIRAGGMPWVLAAGYHMAFQGVWIVDVSRCSRSS